MPWRTIPLLSWFLTKWRGSLRLRHTLVLSGIILLIMGLISTVMVSVQRSSLHEGVEAKGLAFTQAFALGGWAASARSSPHWSGPAPPSGVPWHVWLPTPVCGLAAGGVSRGSPSDTDADAPGAFATSARATPSAHHGQSACLAHCPQCAQPPVCGDRSQSGVGE